MPETKVILLAEDREDDIIMVRRSFERAHIFNPLHVVRDGDEAIQYLAGIGKYSVRVEYPLPSLMLMDLKMPCTDGFEVLKWIRSQRSLSALPVVVLTCSEEMRDVNRAYELGANSFLIKPMDFDNSPSLGQMIKDYWLNFSKLPYTSRPPIGQSEQEKSG
jgi:CheY-like chemotaxis protein